jgi:hypothetical protein
MLAKSTPPISQKAATKPISFVLQNGTEFSPPLQLVIRPEDLTRNEQSRLNVHQTQGDEGSQGWADNWGEGLPSVAINGHTGWRTATATGNDGVAAFLALNDLVYKGFHALKQAAINTGMDPALVKLLFIDVLDGFAWSVAPTNFVLRRNKSRPLLMQYSINLQAISTVIDMPPVDIPGIGSISKGLGALGGVLGKLSGMLGSIKGMISGAMGFVTGLVGNIASTVKGFVSVANGMFQQVQGVVAAVKNGAMGIANEFIGMARDVASVGLNVFRTVSAIKNLPNQIKGDVMAVAGAFNEVKCIFSNSLAPRSTYENYDSLFGASNCSSTSGGRPASPLAGINSLQYLLPSASTSAVSIASNPFASLQVLKNMDPVLGPLSFSEIDRHVSNVTEGLSGLKFA